MGSEKRNLRVVGLWMDTSPIEGSRRLKKELKIKWSHDLAISSLHRPLMNEHLTEVNSPNESAPHRDGCASVCSVALLAIAKRWQQSEGLQRNWCLYTVGRYSAPVENEILEFAETHKDLGNIIVSEIKSTPKRKPLHSSRCVWNLREKPNVQR